MSAIAGDHEAAERVELTLPDTGVCGGAGLFDEVAQEAAPESADLSAAGGCCGTAGDSTQLLTETVTVRS